MNKQIFFDYTDKSANVVCYFVPKPFEDVFKTEHPSHCRVVMPVQIFVSLLVDNENRACFGNYSEKIVTYHP